MKFITYNDDPGGVYRSQVIDVCRFLQKSFGIRVQLIAFVSAREYFSSRKKIKSMYEDSVVLPSFPGITNWGKNALILRLYLLFNKKDYAITRGIFSTLFALKSGKFKKVCMDGRGAIAAEWEEYMSEESPELSKQIKQLEAQALNQADFKIAVSDKLVEYWKQDYGYKGSDYVVIPCTFDSGTKISYSNERANKVRSELGVKYDEILFVFSGSSAGWQSMGRLNNYLEDALKSNPLIKVLFLNKSKDSDKLEQLFPGRISRIWVEPSKVYDYLSAADYGLLYRENTVTNRVSSPVKFAEYLVAGLNVIISENIGDYNSYVVEKNCGQLFDAVKWNELKRTSTEEKLRLQELAKKTLSKEASLEQYRKVIEALS